MITKGSEDWQMMADLYRVYAKATECENPSITTKEQWYRGMETLLNEFAKKYIRKPIARDFAQAIATYISHCTVND